MPTEDLLTSLDIGLRRDINAFIADETAHLKKNTKIKVSAGICEIHADFGMRILYRRGFRSGKRIHIASMSKQFTGAAVAMLQLENATFSMESFVSSVVPGWPQYANAVQVKHLLNHTSGLREYANLGPAWPSYQPSSILPYLANSAISLSQVPGTTFNYNNSGYVVLARIVEIVSGMDFPDFMQTRFFGPLGMSRTFMRGYGDPAPDVMKLYYRNSLFESNRGTWLLDWMPGDGGVQTSIDDLFHWGHFLSGASALGSDIPALMMTPVPRTNGSGSYGFGLNLNRSFAKPAQFAMRNHRFIQIESPGPNYTYHAHSGMMPALRTNSYFFPAQRNKPAVWMGILVNSSNLDETEILNRMRLLYFNKYR